MIEIGCCMRFSLEFLCKKTIQISNEMAKAQRKKIRIQETEESAEPSKPSFESESQP